MTIFFQIVEYQNESFVAQFYSITQTNVNYAFLKLIFTGEETNATGATEVPRRSGNAQGSPACEYRAILRLLGSLERQVQDNDQSQVHRPRHGTHDVRHAQNIPEKVQKDQPARPQVMVPPDPQRTSIFALPHPAGHSSGPQMRQHLHHRAHRLRQDR